MKKKKLGFEKPSKGEDDDRNKIGVHISWSICFPCIPFGSAINRGPVFVVCSIAFDMDEEEQIILQITLMSFYKQQLQNH